MITELDKKTALVLIDLQKGIATPEKAHPVPDILGNAARLVEAFHDVHLPVVVVNVNPKGARHLQARVEIPMMPKPADGQNMAGASSNMSGFTEIVPEIKSKPGDIFITKHGWNAFFETSLHQELQKRGVTGIVLAGISTSIGVEGTARAASELGYNLSFAKDAMTDRSMEGHNHSINLIFPRIGEIGTVDEIIGYIQSQRIK